MSLRENPFRNWPFAASAFRGELHPLCACVDLNGFPVGSNDHECTTQFLHGYPVGLAANSALYPFGVPSVRVSVPDDDGPKPAAKQTAIDSLRANSLKLKNRPKIEQAADRLAPARSVNLSSVSHVTSNKENEHRGRPSPRDTFDGNNNTNYRGSRAPMQPVGNRSVSMATFASTSEHTNSWYSSMASDSQTTMSLGDHTERDTKGKYPSTWMYNSPESTPERSYGAKGPENSYRPKAPEISYGPKSPGVGGITTPFEEHQLPGAAPDFGGFTTPFKEVQHPRAAPGLGKMVLGCSQCLFDPRLQVTPCGCLICIDCGRRFWDTMTSMNSDVFCGCGEVCILSFFIMLKPANLRSASFLHGQPRPSLR